MGGQTVGDGNQRSRVFLGIACPEREIWLEPWGGADPENSIGWVVSLSSKREQRGALSRAGHTQLSEDLRPEQGGSVKTFWHPLSSQSSLYVDLWVAISGSPFSHGHTSLA